MKKFFLILLLGLGCNFAAYAKVSYEVLVPVDMEAENSVTANYTISGY